MVNDALVTAASGWLHLVLDVPRAGWGESIAFWSSVTGWAASDPYGELQQFVTEIAVCLGVTRQAVHKKYAGGRGLLRGEK